jgi:uncharacterized membrane protein YfcA
VPPFISALLIGAVAGAAGALCGVGGGIVMVPAFVFLLGMDQKTAVPTSLAVIIATSVVATANYARSDMVHWKTALPAALGGVLVAYFASEWMKALSNQALTRVFGVTLVAVGLWMLLGKGRP